MYKNAKDYYEVFGEAARTLTAPILISGRNSFQARYESRIIKDILSKLKPSPGNNIFEIGCGTGLLLTPLSRLVTEAVGIDHPSCIAKYKKLGVPANVRLISGCWPKIKINKTFDRILVYSVMHYLKNSRVANLFINKCLSVLKPGGGLMLGDIPNKNLAHRFLNSDYGKHVHSEYIKQRSMHNSSEDLKQRKIFSEAKKQKPYLTDNFVLKLLADMRKRGFEAYVMPQHPDLPFSYTREDILIWKNK